MRFSIATFVWTGSLTDDHLDLVPKVADLGFDEVEVVFDGGGGVDAATLRAARTLGPERVVAVFQPHLYSRTLHTHRELGQALALADVVVVLDVYPARERPEGKLAGVSGKLVADAAADSAHGRPVWWLPTLPEAERVLAGIVEPGDLVLTLGAGDVDDVARGLLERLRDAG